MNGMTMKEPLFLYIFLYFILTAGGLWHILDLFEDVMQFLTVPLILGMTWILIVLTDYLNKSRNLKTAFLLWYGFIFFTSFIIEWIGIRTGFPFGHYKYPKTLQIQLLNIPVFMSFAWVQILISSMAIARLLMIKIIKKNRFIKPWIIFSFLTALLMVLFDVVMEPAAVRLKYWIWENDHIPLQNYAAWFVIGFLFSISGFFTKIKEINFPKLAIHLYISQIIYFIMVQFA
jgi:putative membrane protein